MLKTLLLSACILAPMTVVAQDKTPTAQQSAKKTAKSKYRCDACSMDMKSAKEMRSHMKEHHGMADYCTKCKMGFKTKEEAAGHMKMHAKKK